MQRFVWGMVVGFMLGFLAFADPGGVRSAVVAELRELFQVSPPENAEPERTRRGTWSDDAPPIIQE